MSRTRSVTSRAPWRLTAGAALLAIVVSGCTEDSDTPPQTGTSTTGGQTPTEAAPAEPSDQSAAILGAFQMSREPLAEVTGAWEARASVSRSDVTLRVYAVDAYPDTTRLTFDLFNVDGSPLDYNLWHHWENFPQIATEEGRAAFVNTYTYTSKDNPPARGLFSITAGTRSDFAPLTAQYPPLPAGTSQVEITTPGLGSMTVPVSWHEGR